MNGVALKANVFFEPYDGGFGNIRLSSMGLDFTTGPGTVICIKAPAPCNTQAAMFETKACVLGGAQDAYFDSLLHKCLTIL